MDFPFDTNGCCPACGDAEEDSLLCDACRDMVRNDPRTPAPSGQSADDFIAREERKFVDMLWSSRNVVTGVDLDFLADMKVVYGGCCRLELNAHPKIERTCADCGMPADALGYCENMRRYMECKPKIFSGDRAFLESCGIAVDAGSARGVVCTEIVMLGESVRKAREAHAARNRKPLMADERRGQGAGEIDLGDIS